ncbi:MAG: hypothetical protein IAE86_20530 [Burkholderiaceae bacterium]|nr:hypothetical protein [Burkholderiaceae bacterium]
MVSRRKDTDLSGLAARAERAKTEGDPTGFMSGALFYSDFAIILGGCIDFDPAVPEAEQRRIAMQVAHDSSLPRPITADTLLRACSTLEQDYLSRAPTPQRLLTEISLWWTISVPRTKVGDVALTFKPKLAKAFAARARLATESRGTLGYELPSGYMRVSAHLKARSPHETAERALDALDLVRASWNLALNRGNAWRHTSGRPTPINDIRLSPFHTVHDSAGALATETFWFDPGYSRPAKTFSDKTKFEKILFFATNLRARLRNLSYRDDLERALIRYVRALDSADLNDAFLRLWSLLEYLTDSTHDPFKVATRRAAFMFADRERSQLVLSHLTSHRNRFVHVGSDTEDIESLVFQLKRYVDALLLFHLGNRFRFESRSEAARFMDQPPDKTELRRRQKRILQAQKFISGGA